jgi:hypothetical protein
MNLHRLVRYAYMINEQDEEDPDKDAFFRAKKNIIIPAYYKSISKKSTNLDKKL